MKVFVTNEGRIVDHAHNETIEGMLQPMSLCRRDLLQWRRLFSMTCIDRIEQKA
jgi:hypothetical protein